MSDESTSITLTATSMSESVNPTTVKITMYDDDRYMVTTSSVTVTNNQSDADGTIPVFSLTIESIISIAAGSIVIVVGIFGILMWMAGYKCHKRSEGPKEVFTTDQTHKDKQQSPSPIYEEIDESYLREYQQIELNKNKAYTGRATQQADEAVYYNASAIRNADQCIYSTCN